MLDETIANIKVEEVGKQLQTLIAKQKKTLYGLSPLIIEWFKLKKRYWKLRKQFFNSFFNVIKISKHYACTQCITCL